MTRHLQVTLLHGLTEAGRRHTAAQLREPTGYDEVILADLREHATPAEQMTVLLAALTMRVGAVERPAPDRIRELTAGDRGRLLLALCARLLGSETDLVAACPACGALAEVTVRFAALSSADGIADVPVALTANGERWTARLRPPNGFDLERAARGGPGAARQMMLACIENLRDPSGQSVAPDRLPRACEAALADALLALDRAAETRFTIECPSCGAPVDALLDEYAVLQSGFGNADRLHADVFRMAQTYGWSEADILGLPLQRRRRYIAVAEARR